VNRPDTPVFADEPLPGLIVGDTSSFDPKADGHFKPFVDERPKLLWVAITTELSGQ
jgi:hypothetical protein